MISNYHQGVIGPLLEVKYRGLTEKGASEHGQGDLLEKRGISAKTYRTRGLLRPGRGTEKTW